MAYTAQYVNAGESAAMKVETPHLSKGDTHLVDIVHGTQDSVTLYTHKLGTALLSHDNNVGLLALCKGALTAMMACLQVFFHVCHDGVAASTCVLCSEYCLPIIKQDMVPVLQRIFDLIPADMLQVSFLWMQGRGTDVTTTQ